MKSENKIARNITLLCFVSSVICGALALLIASKGGPEALGMIIPILLAGGVHLTTGPVAIFYAYRSYPASKGMWIYAYFFFFNLVVLVISKGEVFLFTLLFVLFAAAPIIISAFRHRTGK